MAFYQFKREQFIKTDLDTLWQFISSPHNLTKITPKEMNFKITSPYLSSSMYAGMIISYKVTLMPFVKTTWVTEISQVKDKSYFVDTQLQGPYKIWHHQHLLKQKDDGILMTDLISYAPPLGFIGSIANFLFIRRQLKRIFDYREAAMNRLFP
nr:SRPBCC family protein [uncultured Carboxylicivirga sp.]